MAPYKELAAGHPGGLVDLSIGTPVDPTPEIARQALTAASDAPGYPYVRGTTALRDAAAGWLRRRLGVSAADPDAVLPVIGTKEVIAWLPTLLEAGLVAFPALAYPTYDIGARLARAEPVPWSSLDDLDGLGTEWTLLWVNSPSNPTGRVLSAAELREIVAWGRERGVVIASDECYIELGWETEPVSILHPDVCQGSHDGLIAVHSLSKRSNLAGYRAGFIAGDPAIVGTLTEVRRHAGMMIPAPVQAAMTAALGDDEHVARQRERYARRRSALKAALESHGLRVDYSEAALYLWATRDEPCWDTVKTLAGRGILVAPGEFYGSAGARHVRVAFTATDEAIAEAAARL